MKTIFRLFVVLGFVLSFPSLCTFSQVSINSDGTSADPSAMLDVKSTTKGMLIPRMTASQRTGISSAASGLLVYQTDGTAGLYFYNGTGWLSLGTGGSGSGNMIDADGNTYLTVKIGTQEWMAENIRATHYRNGDAIPKITDNTTWAGLITGARCYYDNDSITNNPVYGALYNWYAVNDSRNLCPTGWHVPSDDEYGTLITYLGGFIIAGGQMKTTILFNSPNTGATNTSGFSGRPGGDRNEDGSFGGTLHIIGNWWSTTENISNTAFVRTVGAYDSGIFREYPGKNYGGSVRCVRD